MVGFTILWWGLVTAPTAAAAPTATHHIATDICVVTAPQLAIEVERIGESLVLRRVAARSLPGPTTTASFGL